MKKCGDAGKLLIIGGPWNVEIVVHRLLVFVDPA